MKKWFGALLLILAVVSPLEACPGCKDPQTQTATVDVKTVQMSFSWSVLFLLAVPFSIMSAFAFMIVKIEKGRPTPPPS